MADIDRAKFAYAVAGRMKAIGEADGLARPLDYREAQRRFAGVSVGSLSRIANSIAVSAPVMLAVCKALELDPFDYLDTGAPHPHSNFGLAHDEKKALANHQRKQGVSVGVTRETSSVSAGGSAPASVHGLALPSAACPATEGSAPDGAFAVLGVSLKKRGR